MWDAVQTKDLAAPDVEGQTEQVMKNLGAVLEAAGSSFAKVVKTTVLLQDMADFAKVNAIYGTCPDLHYSVHFPFLPL